jgi:6-pyruvoyl-tetrahydropterin synthase related domain
MSASLLSRMFGRSILRENRATVVERRLADSDSFCVLVVTLVGLGAILPMAIYGVPNGADLPNHLRFALPFYEALRSGNFHPAWLAESNYGLGDLRFTVYPPGLYYLMSAARSLTGDWYSATVSVFALLSVTGGLGAYLWARSFLNPRLALWAGVFYVLAPYRLNEIYQASLLSEYAACSLLPFAFAFVERICSRKNSIDVLGLGAAYALLILTHLPLTVIGSMSLALYALFRLFADKTGSDNSSRRPIEQILRNAGRLAIGVAIGLSAGSFFWTSMIAELPWIKAHGTEPNAYYDYRLNFLFSTGALTNRNTWYANLLALVVLASLLPGLALLKNWFRRDSTAAAVRGLFIVLLASFLMATPLSRPIWMLVPKLSEIQFPWRWLSVTSLTGSLLLAAAIPMWKDRLRNAVRPRDLVVGFAFVLALIFIGSQIIYDTEYLGHASFQAMTWEIRGAVSFKDFLPLWARDFNSVEKMRNKIDAGSRAVAITTWDSEHRTFHLDQGEATSVRVQTYFYPHWIAHSAGRILPSSATNDGLLLISGLPKQAADIALDFERPARVRVFEILSLATWLLILSAALYRPMKFRTAATPLNRWPELQNRSRY